MRVFRVVELIAWVFEAMGHDNVTLALIQCCRNLAR